MKLGRPKIYTDHLKMICDAKKYPRDRWYFKCPNCGNIRHLKSTYIVRSDFRDRQFAKCPECNDRKRRITESKFVMVSCARCRKTRNISRTTYIQNSYSKYCPDCSRIIAKNQTITDEFCQRAIADLPTTATPISDPLKPCETRQYFCIHYDKCLDYCIAKKWPGFSCRECTGGELEPMEQRMMPWSTIMEILPDVRL